MEQSEFHAVLHRACNQNKGVNVMISKCRKLYDLKHELKDLIHYMASYAQRLNQTRQKLEEKELLAEIDKWSNIEEQALRQKSRASSIMCGDTNSKYLHAQWNIRQRKNTITYVYTDAGIKLTDPTQVKTEFITFFTGLMENCSGHIICPNSEVIKKRTVLEYGTEKCIDTTNDKAPEIDGYPIEFFTKNWDLMKKEVYVAVQSFFEIGKLLRKVNCTTIILIPKVSSPSQAKDYRSIACCNTFHKIIFKVLQLRIKKVIGNLIRHSQSAFIEGRSIIDNILYNYELFKGYNRKGVSPRCVMKVDLRNAYDTIDWRFLRRMLNDLGFHLKFIEWIMECVATVSYPLVLNGRLTKLFLIRQGDPMSPYLFIIAMENLQREVMQLAENDIESIKLLRGAFHRFSAAFGLQANTDKISIYLVGVDAYERQAIMKLLGFE
uniref:Reverse transcriptase domain-containing protein n=1 Tax=Nicotiana tabacum TaxID=4097 RepID=A0A1S4B406_TOBAC|nr:PREDICTED: uncharacterized protein LOC107804238 [Nicotiana tabacum]